MKKTIFALTLLVLISSASNAQFSMVGYNKMIVKNDNQPEFTRYAKDGSKLDETYIDWEVHYLRIQKANYSVENGETIVSSVLEQYLHFEDVNDEFIDAQIAKGYKAFSEINQSNSEYGYAMKGNNKILKTFKIEVKTKEKVTASAHSNDGNFEGNYWNWAEFELTDKAAAQNFFKTLKEKKWDAMLDLTDATKRVPVPYYGITKNEAIRAYNEAQRKNTTTNINSEPTTSSSSNTPSSTSSNTKEKTEIYVRLFNKSDVKVKVEIRNPSGSSKSLFEVNQRNSKQQKVKIGATIFINGVLTTTITAAMEDKEIIIAQ
jgi:hypothetical protein